MSSAHSVVSASDLNDQQRLALNAVAAGHSLLVSGGAGVGKSHLARAIRDAVGERNTLACAFTGKAALEIGGITIHKLLSGQSAPLLASARVLLIDEISMAPPALLLALYATCRRARQCDAPWGGLQVIAIGDTCQLPPVITEEKDIERAMKDWGTTYFFGPNLWSRFRLVELTQPMRFADPILSNALAELRFGRCPPSIAAIFAGCVKPRPRDSLAIVLTNKRADEINHEELAQLPHAPLIYSAAITGNIKQSDYPTETELTIKTGARVLMIRNDYDAGFRNGDLGTVEYAAFDHVLVRLDRGPVVEVKRHKFEISEPYVHETKAKDGTVTTEIRQRIAGVFTQLPMRLGWAITAHKAQGASLDKAHVDLTGCSRMHGQAYVALSRVRSLAGFTLEHPLQQSDFLFDPQSQAYRKVFQPLAEITEQVRGCTAYNHSGKPHIGDVQLASCPLARNGCPRVRKLVEQPTTAAVAAHT